MDQKLLDILYNQAVSVLSLVRPDGTVHSATMHFATATDPLRIYFHTPKTSRKVDGMHVGMSTPAAVTIGFSEEEWTTLQMEGTARLITDSAEMETAKNMYYGKYPDARKYEKEGDVILIEFTPSWWRYTDYKTEPPTVIS